MNISTTYVDGTDSLNIVKAIRSNTRLVWLESSSNPKVQVVDIKDIVTKTRLVDPQIIITVNEST